MLLWWVMRRWIPALALLLAPVTANAWCLLGRDPGAYAGFWRAKFSDLRIPVYISVGVDSSVLFTGWSEAQMTTMVRRMIAVHNETVGSPILYFAGTTEAELGVDGGMQARPPGIVIDSFSCIIAESAPRCSDKQLACTRPGGNSDDLVSKARVTLKPSSQLCGNVGVLWGLQAEGRDTTRAVLHELGHALGLGHTDDSQCAGASSGRGGAGVMEALHGSNAVYARAWRRDDLEGLRAIYGAAPGSVYLWEDDRFPGAPETSRSTAVCAEMHTPPALTTGTSDTLLLGFTDADDRVSMLEWAGSRFVVPVGGAQIDPSAQGKSFAPVALAHSDAGGVDEPVVLAVWSADDGRTLPETRLRWALRPLAGGAWTYGDLTTPSGPTQSSNRVALGFDPGAQLFLVVGLTVDAQPYIIAMDRQGVQRATTVPGAAADPPIHAFDIGRPNCFVDGDQVSRCTVPYINGNFDAFDNGELLDPGWLDLTVAGDGSTTLVNSRRSKLFSAPGLPDLASGPTDQRGVVGDQRYALMPGDPVPVLDSERLAADDWPLRIGSHILATDAVTYRIAARGLAASCGDGMSACAEQCDDGNQIDGDGCSARCMLEPAEESTGATATGPDSDDASSGEGSGSTGGPGEVPVDAGCDCDLGARPAPLFGLGLLLLRRRVRRPST